jgi:hypothetical protein
MQITSEELSSPLREKLKSLQDNGDLSIRQGGKDLESASISDIKFLENGITEGDFGEGFNYKVNGSCQLRNDFEETFEKFECVLEVEITKKGAKLKCEVQEIKDNTIDIVR